MGLFRGAVFLQGGGAGKQPIKKPTDMPTSTMAFMGRFPCLMGFSSLNGAFPRFRPTGAVLPLENPLRKQPIKKRGIKRFLSQGNF